MVVPKKMVGPSGDVANPGDPNEEKCMKYAKFLAHLDHPQFDWLYWAVFTLNICLFLVSSWVYQWVMRYRMEKDDTIEFSEHYFRRRVRLAFGISCVITAIAIVLCVIQVFALLSLQFCDGEDLMPLFWATWTMLQMGSTIANSGILMQLWHLLCDVRQPPWNIALGTPVLVTAGLGHIVLFGLEWTFKKWKKDFVARKQRKAQSSECRASRGPETSQWSSSATLAPDGREQ